VYNEGGFRAAEGAMVKLDRIYTRGGDAGETSLADGARVPKHALRIVALGEVDEANAAIGLARSLAADAALDDQLARIQNDLFDLGADIAVPGASGGDQRLRIAATQVARLEAEIDAARAAQTPLDSFVLPGGSPLAAQLHFARAVVRRAERAIVVLAAAEPVNGQAIAYLNRLSDHLFVAARRANDNGKADVLWRPGASR
jgi:cob(I)alamin adenosyltransferase